MIYHYVAILGGSLALGQPRTATVLVLGTGCAAANAHTNVRGPPLNGRDILDRHRDLVCR